VIDAVYRAESRCVLATLIRLLGGFELEEEALHEARRRGRRAVAPRNRLVAGAGFEPAKEHIEN
jgi:predicted RNA polymerase sigma factor